MPGGVNSPVRSFRSVGSAPFFVGRGEGPFLWDTEGRRYVDYVLSWGPLILGHAPPAVMEALRLQLGRGTSYGASTEGEVELAERIIRLMPGIEMVRLVNSGTEATMSALRVVRAATGRDIVLKFSGCYHGHADAFLVAAGSGVATLGLPDSPGVTRAAAGDTMVAPFNDLDAVADALRERGDAVAAVFVEPVVGNAGLIEPLPGFLSGLRELTQRHGALLVFDEVMTGFRVSLGGAQARYDVEPDMTTLGKVIGGGLPVGAYGGRRDLMDQVAPAGPVYQAGTLSGNPLATAAGNAQLAWLEAARPVHSASKPSPGVSLSWYCGGDPVRRSARRGRRRGLNDRGVLPRRELPRSFEEAKGLRRPHLRTLPPRDAESRRLPGAFAVRGGVRVHGTRRRGSRSDPCGRRRRRLKRSRKRIR